MLRISYKSIALNILFFAIAVFTAKGEVFWQHLTKQRQTTFAQSSSPTTFASPVLTEFTFQRRLLDNNLSANRTSDFQFNSKDTEAILGTAQRSGVPVVNRIFAVRLDFGRNFPAEAARFLQIGVKTVGTVAYTPLTQVQPIAATHYAATPRTTRSTRKIRRLKSAWGNSNERYFESALSGRKTSENRFADRHGLETLEERIGNTDQSPRLLAHREKKQAQINFLVTRLAVRRRKQPAKRHDFETARMVTEKSRNYQE